MDTAYGTRNVIRQAEPLLAALKIAVRRDIGVLHARLAQDASVLTVDTAEDAERLAHALGPGATKHRYAWRCTHAGGVVMVEVQGRPELGGIS